MQAWIYVRCSKIKQFPTRQSTQSKNQLSLYLELRRRKVCEIQISNLNKNRLFEKFCTHGKEWNILTSMWGNGIKDNLDIIPLCVRCDTLAAFGMVQNFWELPWVNVDDYQDYL